MSIKIGVLGCGTVGSGVVKLLQKKASLYAHRCGQPVEVKKILVRDLSKVRATEISSAILTTHPDDILEDPEIQVVVEVLGGEHPAREYLLKAIRAGKHVVSANKAVIALHGKELFDTASEKGVSFYFEGAVAGGIPVIQAVKRSLVANTVTSLYGIINGTTNYILSAMTHDKREFADVLKEAQELGYAEADPTDDVEGYDVAYKLAILSSLVFGKRLQVADIHRVGIQNIAARDIEYARQFGYAIKLLAIAKQGEQGFEARVHPTMIPIEHPLALVNGAFNAILMKGDAVGDIMFYGRGAGEMPTASAVVGDILNLVSDIQTGGNSLMACQHTDTAVLNSIDDIINRYYVRILTEDKPGVLGHIGDILGEAAVSVHTLIQHKEGEGNAELLFITHPIVEQRLRQAISSINHLETTRDVYNIIRVEDFE